MSIKNSGLSKNGDDLNKNLGIPILWKYIFALEERIVKVENMIAANNNLDKNRDKAESDTKELTEEELNKVLNTLVTSEPKDLNDEDEEYLLLKAKEELEKTKKRQKYFINELEKVKDSQKKLKEASVNLSNSKNGESISANINKNINYYKGYIIPKFNAKLNMVIKPEKVPSDEYFLSNEYRKLIEAKIKIQPNCEFSDEKAEYVMHKTYDNLGSETPNDMWSLCEYHYLQVIGKNPKISEAPFDVKFVLISPNNYVFKVETISTFANANDLRSTSLSDVARGRNSHHKGWKCYRINDYLRVLEHLKKKNVRVHDSWVFNKNPLYPSIRSLNELHGIRNAKK